MISFPLSSSPLITHFSIYLYFTFIFLGGRVLPYSLVGKESTCNAGHPSSIPNLYWIYYNTASVLCFGFLTVRHPFPTRDSTCTSCMGRWSLNHWTAMKVPAFTFIITFFFRSFFFHFFISWRLITLQYCSGFLDSLTWISHNLSYRGQGRDLTAWKLNFEIGILKDNWIALQKCRSRKRTEEKKVRREISRAWIRTITI